MASMKQLRKIMRCLLWQQKYFRLTKHAKLVLWHRRILRHWWRSRHYKNYRKRSQSSAPSKLRPARLNMLWVVVCIFYYLLVFFLGGLVGTGCLDYFELWLSVLSVWVCGISSLVYCGCNSMVRRLLRGSDRALHSLLGSIYTGVQIRIYRGDLLVFCTCPLSIRHQNCAEDGQCVWPLPLLTPLILKNWMFLLVGLASTFPVEWASLAIPPLLWEPSACAETALCAWVSRQVNSLSSTVCYSLVAHLGIEFFGAGWFSLNNLGPGCQLLASLWVGCCLLLLLCSWELGAIVTKQFERTPGASAHLMVGVIAGNVAVT
jgi:hypothetical protein